MMSWEAVRPCPWPGNAWAGLRHQGWGWGLTWMLQAQTTAIQGLKSSCSVPRRHAQDALAVVLLRRCGGCLVPAGGRCAPGKGCRCGPDLFSRPLGWAALAPGLGQGWIQQGSWAWPQGVLPPACLRW